MLDGSSRLNLATFVTTWMDPEAGQLMSETFDKNMIDKDEYPVTAAIEQRCVCMVADLFHAEDLRDDDPSSAIGVSTVGSSEAVMLVGLALKWRWRQKLEAAGQDWKGRTPNLVMGSNVQVVWEKFCRYFDVEARYLLIAVPEGFEGGAINEHARHLNPNLQVIARAHSDAEVAHLEALLAAEIQL